MINAAGLNRAYKKSINFIWGLMEGRHYIVCDCFIISSTDLPKKVKDKLFNILQMVPSENEMVKKKVSDNESSKETFNRNWKDMIDKEQDARIEHTGLIVDELSVFYNFKEKRYIYIDKRYFDSINMDEKVRIEGSTPESPVYFEKGSTRCLILPVRQSNHNKYLKKEEEVNE